MSDVGGSTSTCSQVGAGQPLQRQVRASCLVTDQTALTRAVANSLAFSTSVPSNSRNSSQRQLGEAARPPISLQHVPPPREQHTIHPGD